MSRVRIEIVCLALVAILPLVPYLALILGTGAPRFTLHADLALIEHDVRHVWSGDTLLGLESRFGWHHPGPLFFYLCAPFERLFRPSSTGLYMGTWCIAAFAAVAPVVAARLHAGRTTALAVLAMTLAWFAAYGNLAVNPWNRTVVVFPFLGYFALMALFAHGSSACLLPALILGTLVAHTHVASVSTVGAVGVLATAAFLVGARRRYGDLRSVPRKDWSRMKVAAALLVLLFAPLVIEELRAPSEQGNLTKLYRFVRERQEPFLPWSVAWKDWALAASWLPDRLLEAKLFEEGQVPEPMLWYPVAVGVSRTAGALIAVEIGLVVVGAVVAFRRRDSVSLSFLALGVIGTLLAASALRSIVGEEHNSLIFWSAVPTCTALTGAISALASALAPRLERLRQRQRILVPAALATGLTLAVLPVILNRAWLTKNAFAPGSVPEMTSFLQRSFSDITAEVKKADAVPVIHMIGAWWWASAMVLELEKDGYDVRIADRDAWWFAGAKSAAGEPRALHLYFDCPSEPLPVADCVDRLIKYEACGIYASATDITTCDAQVEADR